ncbi:hypothetical protein LSTR_LSTR011930 [Laodelphax striatellus]|uniref:RRM domain-containing protein n=1 Tax=Laodelphax striatellus TaxID=195883 RepID=A0A482WZH1_LAOST|nr:hypothetical protein LSTR_LSTR011930 [Laodelphax striatellus]
MSSDHDEESTIVKMRGLPWSATVEEIAKFFDGCNIRGGKNGVQMTMSREGRPSGEAYVELETEEDVQKALKKDRDHMGPRYIEVFRAKRSEMEWVLRRSGMTFDNAIDEGCVRLRGLPFGCTKDEITDFFKGLEIVSNGIILPTDYTGRSTGEAYVEFVNKDMAEKALQKHKEKIGHRYIEIFRSSRAEVRSMSLRSRPMGGGGGGGGGSGGGFNPRPAPYDRGDRFGGLNRYNSNNNMGPLSRPSRNFKSSYSGRGFGDFDDGPWEPSPWNNNRDLRDLRDLRGNGPSRGGNMLSSRGNQNSFNDNGGGGPWNDGPMHVIHMRGLPFRANQADIADFFRPINPVNIRLLCDDNGRPSGEADVEFMTREDAVRAMAKNQKMQHRYIELFLNSAGGGGGGGSGGFGNNSFNGGGGYGGSGTFA